LKAKYKEIESQPAAKRIKSIIELIFGGSSIERFKIERREDVVSYERYKVEREQRMFDESFYIVDMEDATEEETDDLRMIITIIFNHFNEMCDSSKNSRRRGSEPDELNLAKRTSISNKLFDDQQIVNVNRVQKLFNKASLRDSFIKECVVRIPEKTQIISISHESFTNMSIVLMSIIKHMENVHDTEAAKVLDVVRIINTYYSKSDEQKRFLLHQFKDVAMFRDILM
jgi:hypothetical protein